MNKKQFVSEMSSRLLMKRYHVANYVDFLLEVLAEKFLSGEKVTLSGFGTFQLRERQAKRIVHPARSTILYLPATRFLKFVPSRNLLRSFGKEDG